MRKSKFTESQIIKAIKANENGQRVEDLCRELGIGGDGSAECKARTCDHLIMSQKTFTTID